MVDSDEKMILECFMVLLKRCVWGNECCLKNSLKCANENLKKIFVDNLWKK